MSHRIDQRRRPLARLALAQLGQALGPQRAAQRGAEVDARAAARRPVAPRAAQRHRQAQPRDGAQRLVDLGLRHLLEVAVLQDLAVGEGEGRLDLDLGRLVLRPSAPRRGRAASASCRRRLSCFLSSGSAGTPTCGSSISIIFSSSRGLRQIDVERLVEDLALVAAVHEHRVQRPVEVVALLAGRPPRPPRRRAAPGPDRRAGRRCAACGRNARCCWRACRAALGCRGGFGERVHHILPDRARPRALMIMSARETRAVRKMTMLPSHALSQRLRPRCRTSPCAGSRRLPSPAGAGCRPGTSAARPACR